MQSGALVLLIKSVFKCFSGGDLFLVPIKTVDEQQTKELLIVCQKTQKYYDNEVFQIAIKCKFSFN